MKALTNLMLTLVLITVTTTTIANDDKQHKHRDNKQQIVQVFKNYMQKYNHFIAKQELQLSPVLYTEQVMLITGNGKPTTLTPDKMNQGVSGFLTRLKTKGVNKVAWEKIEIKLLSDNIALASNIAIRYLAGGKVYDRAGATYFLSKTEQGWQISSFALHDPDKAINFLSES